jgi:transposase-like protein
MLPRLNEASQGRPLKHAQPNVAKLRATNVIERCFVEVRRRTRPMVSYVNVESVDCIIYSIF